MNSKALTLVLLGLATATAAVAQDFEALVMERQNGMKTMSSANRTLKPIMDGTADYDAAKVREAAQAIAAHSGQTLIDWFPEGSIVGDSDAKPEIWTDPEGFAAIAMALNDHAVALEAAADRGLGASDDAASTATLLGTAPADAPLDLQTASADAIYAEMGATCGTCHKTYRVNRN